MVVNWAGPPAMISLFRKMYGSHSCPDIVRRNHFNNFQHYFLQKALVVAMSKQRNIHGICPPEILKFVLDLFKYNDNSRNKVCCQMYSVIHSFWTYMLAINLCRYKTRGYFQNTFWSPMSLFLLQYSDNYYKAALIDAAAATITPAITTVTITGYLYF